MAKHTPARSSARKRSRARRAAPKAKKTTPIRAPRPPANGRRGAIRGNDSAEEILPALREKFEQLGNRWKSLLPRLTKSGVGSNGANGSNGASHRRRAPGKSKTRRRR